MKQERMIDVVTKNQSTVVLKVELGFDLPDFHCRVVSWSAKEGASGQA